MVRACCVPGCTSGKKAPSHRFPRNAQRRLQWYTNLNMEPVEGLEEQKLRVCYKHFRDSDYNCSHKMRVLVSNAIPSTNITLDESNVTEITSQTSQDIEEIEQTGNEHDSLTSLTSLTVDLHQKEQERTEEIITQHDEYITLQQEDINSNQPNPEQNKAPTEETTILDKLVKLPRQTHHRPDLRDITRKSALCSTARQLYDTTVKLKRQKRYLKRLCKKYKEDSRVKTITLNTADYKGRIDSCAPIRQQFVDMVIRNNDVAPQVKNVK